MKTLTPTNSRHTRNVPNVKRALGLLFGVSDDDGHLVQLRRTRLTYGQVAAQCRCSVAAVRKIKVAAEDGGLQAAVDLKWGAGPPRKDKYAVHELEWLLDPATIKQQAHMSLAERAAAFNQLLTRRWGATS